MLFHLAAVPICTPINSGQGSGCPVPSVYTSVNLLFMFWAIVILMETNFSLQFGDAEHTFTPIEHLDVII